MPNALEIEGLSKRFGGLVAVDNVNLAVRQGDVHCVIGPNGAGKSTLVKAVFGLVKIRSGSVRLGTEDITSLPAHKLVAAGVGYVPQRENVFGALTVEENLRMGLYLRPDAWDERWEFVTEMFPRLGERATQRAGLLSGGERQMLAMGRALMMDPSVLLLDEPSAGLSPANQDLIFEQVRAICDTGVSVLMVEQNARRCLQICDRAYVLDQGKDAHTGTGHDLLHDPKVVELYLGMLGKVD